MTSPQAGKQKEFSIRAVTRTVSPSTARSREKASPHRSERREIHGQISPKEDRPIKPAKITQALGLTTSAQRAAATEATPIQSKGDELNRDPVFVEVAGILRANQPSF